MRRDIIQHLLDIQNVLATHDATGEPTGNVSDQDFARLREAQNKCRQLATKMLSFYQIGFVAEHLLRWCWHYNVLKAGRSLIGLSNDLPVPLPHLLGDLPCSSLSSMTATPMNALARPSTPTTPRAAHCSSSAPANGDTRLNSCARPKTAQ